MCNFTHRLLVMIVSLTAVAMLSFGSTGRAEIPDPSRCLVSLLPSQNAPSSNPRKLENAGEMQQVGGRRVALVIGNTNYLLGKLQNPTHDADDMAAFLKSAGFEVIEKKDLSGEGMEQAVAEFGKKIQGAAVALFYYSGHGVQAKGVNFLVPVTHNIRSEADIVLQAMPLHRVFEQFESAKTTVNLVLLDACRNDPFERSLKAVSRRGLAEVSAPRGTLIAFAAAPGQTSDDNQEGRNGLWTQEFLKVAKQSGQELRDILDSAGAAVEMASNNEQVPWLNSSLRQKVVFLGKGKEIDPKRPTLSKYGVEMVSIPAGNFLMGDSDQLDNPRHTVYLDGYSISKNLITVDQYLVFCAATKHERPTAPDFNPNWSKTDHPIVNVSWNDAMDYCRWLSKETGLQVTLPTEAQWERAARGTSGLKFPWGNEWDGTRCANSVGSNNLSSTMPVGSYPKGASPDGVLDMAGNVWQWCSDYYSADYLKGALPGNPTGPPTGTARVLRGGSWYYFLVYFFRCAFRNWFTPDTWYSDGGFRCVVLADSR